MRRSAAARLALIALFALLVACASDGEEAPAPHTAKVSATVEMASGAAAATPAGLRIFATGDVQGFLGPCGCEDSQFGGIARRGRYLAEAGRDDDLRVDLGNAAAGSGALRDLRLRMTLEALERMGYDAFVPAAADVESGETLLAAAAERPGVAVVSANVVGPGGRPVFPPSLAVRAPDGRLVLLVGVTGEGGGAPAGWRVTPPEEAVRRAIAGAGPADAVVLAAAMPAGAAQALAARLEGVTVALSGGPEADRMAAMSATGHSAKDADEDFRGAHPPLAVAGDFASYVRRIDLGADLRQARTWRAWLGEDVADDAALAALHKEYRAQVATLDPDLIPDILRGLAARGFAGSSACLECHDDDHAAWAGSLHAKGMATLVEKESSRDPDCVPCHLVDVRDGAAEDLSVADGLGIGCEACHAGRAKHVELARADRLDEERPPPFTAREVCTGCHHPPEVESFDFDVQWPRIEHGD